MKRILVITSLWTAVIVASALAQQEPAAKSPEAGAAAGDATGSPQKTAPVSATFLVTGLHCPPCTTTVETSLRRIRGVRAISVDWNSKSATVTYDEGTISAQKVAASIAATPHMMGNTMRYGGWLALKVPGIDKPETAKKVKAALGSVKGVANTAVYEKTEAVGVAFAPEGNLTMQELLTALEKEGIPASSYARDTKKKADR